MRVALLSLMIACAGQSAPSPVESASAGTPAKPAGDAVFATWDGGTLTQADVEAKIAGELRSMEMEYLTGRYEALQQATNSMIDEALLEAEAKKRGFDDIDALLAEEIEKKAAMPDEAAIAATYAQVKGQLQGASLDEARPFIAQQLMQQQMADSYQAYIKSLRTAAKVAESVPYPEMAKVAVEVRDDDPVLGDKDAPVTIVQFAEYQCYFCNKASPTLKQLLKDYDGKVRLVYKDYPLPNHPDAAPAAKAAHCAGEQGKYWEMSDLLLGNQQALKPANFTEYGTQIGLKAKDFEACLESDRHADGIAMDIEDARKAGVQATPTFFVNGVLVSGAQPYDRFAAVIDRALAAR